MKVHVINHTRHDFVIHRVGCADVEKTRRRGEINSDWLFDVPDGADVATAVATDISEGFDGWTVDSGEPMAWPPEYMRVMPCVAK